MLNTQFLAVHNMYLSETNFKLNSPETSFIHNARFGCPMVFKLHKSFAQGKAVSLLYSVQNFKTIG